MENLTGNAEEQDDPVCEVEPEVELKHAGRLAAEDLVLGKRHDYGGQAPGILNEADRLGFSKPEVEHLRRIYDFRYRARLKAMGQPKL